MTTSVDGLEIVLPSWQRSRDGSRGCQAVGRAGGRCAVVWPGWMEAVAQWSGQCRRPPRSGLASVGDGPDRVGARAGGLVWATARAVVWPLPTPRAVVWPLPTTAQWSGQCPQRTSRLARPLPSPDFEKRPRLAQSSLCGRLLRRGDQGSIRDLASRRNPREGTQSVPALQRLLHRSTERGSQDVGQQPSVTAPAAVAIRLSPSPVRPGLARRAAFRPHGVRAFRPMQSRFTARLSPTRILEISAHGREGTRLRHRRSQATSRRR